MTDHTYAGHTAKQIRTACTTEPWTALVAVVAPPVVIAMLDRIAELEKRPARRRRLFDLIEQQVEQIASLQAQIAALEPDAEKWRQFHGRLTQALGGSRATTGSQR
ncbi:hypothetical protein GCM10027202_12250 [Microvirgula curvata]